MENTKIAVQPYFGKWGGFFVPDPMTPALDELSTTTNELIQDPEFAKKVVEIAQAPEENSFISSDAEHVFTAKSAVRKYIAAGYALVAKETDKEVIAGAVNTEEATLIVEICKKVGVSLSLWLNVQTGSNEAFVKSLTDDGITVNLDQCRELFDDPEMYSFQRYIANPMKHQWMPIHSHCGPAPFPAFTMYLASLAADKVFSAATSKFGNKKLNFVCPAISGLTVVGMLAAKENNIALYTYGPKADSEREECYLGTYTKVHMVGITEFLMSPVVIDAWETGKITQENTVSPLLDFANKEAKEVYVVMEE